MTVLLSNRTCFNGIKLTTFALLLMFCTILSSCKKTAFYVEGVTDQPLYVGKIMVAGDGYYTRLYWPTVMELKGDGSFTIKTDRGTCKGFYNWTNTGVQQAKVRFVITKWHSSGSEKLKQVLSTVEKCYIDKNPSNWSSWITDLEVNFYGPGGDFTLMQ